jgi:hypothetical protein
VVGLTTGVTYKFKVAARNEYGLSFDSNEVFILAAQLPDVPEAPTTTISGSNVLIDWEMPNFQGSAI